MGTVLGPLLFSLHINDITSDIESEIRLFADDCVCVCAMCAPKPIGPLLFLFSCPQDVREAAYKGLVRPILEYGSSVWDPHYEGLIDDLEKVQKRAARFVTRNYTYEKGSMTDILNKLKWESLQKRRKDNRIILLYKGLKGRAKIPTDDLIPKNRRCRNQHSLAFQIPSASTNAYLHSFFPQTIRDWNELPDSLISSAELNCQMIVCLNLLLL